MVIGKRVYIVRYGAFGDVIHCSHVPRLLKEKYGVEYIAFETNIKGEQILRNNPFIDNLVVIDPSRPPLCNLPMSFLERCWEVRKNADGCDTLISLMNSIERGYIAMEDSFEYYVGEEYRRKKFGELNYYDQTMHFMGLNDRGIKGEMFFTDQEKAVVDNVWNANYKDKFVVVCNLSGTSKHKLFYGAEDIIKSFLAKHEDAVCILTGDNSANKFLSFEGDRIINRAGDFTVNGNAMSYPFRQSVLVASKADLVIGCESGLMVAANMMEVPTVQLMTAASIKNHGGDCNNDYSLQSPCRCSPCHKGPYIYIGCPKFEYLGEEYPECVKFDKDIVLNRMEEVYAKH